jgi:hypothetical protein
MRKIHPLHYRFLCAFVGVLVFFLLMLFAGWPKVTKDINYGITWSIPYAQFLGVDSQDGLEAVLTDMDIKHVRIPAYWPLVEPMPDLLQTDWLVAQLDIVQKHGAKATVVLGARQPRWPECWIPDWALALTEDEQKAAQLVYIDHVFETIKDHPAIGAWQIENEATLRSFMKCRGNDNAFVKQELNHIRNLEQKRPNPRPIVTTESGELTSWLTFAAHTDRIGFSTYRVVRRSSGGVFRYSLIPPWFYSRKALLVSWILKETYVSEFQMEPWATTDIRNATQEDNDQTFSVADVEKHFDFAERMNYQQIDLWGAEWWYWMKTQQGNDGYWNAIKTRVNTAK